MHIIIQKTTKKTSLTPNNLITQIHKKHFNKPQAQKECQTKISLLFVQLKKCLNLETTPKDRNNQSITHLKIDVYKHTHTQTKKNIQKHTKAKTHTQ